MKNTEQYLRKLLKRSINETLESKANKLMGKIKGMEMEEGWDSPEIKKSMDGEDFNPKKFKKYKIDWEDLLQRSDEKPLKKDKLDGDDDLEFTEETCEVCGSELEEGQCNECGGGKMYEGDLSGEFDYTEEEGDDEDAEDIIERYCNKSSEWFNENRCAYNKKIMSESKKLVGKQKKLDKNKNNKIDSEDFKLLRKSKKSKIKSDETEVEEGNEFTGALAKAKKQGKKEFEVDGKTYPVKESIEYHIRDNQGDIIKLNENEMVDLIEEIVNEEKSKLKSLTRPQGLMTYEKAHKESGKENKEYMKSLQKKMSDYLKDGSKEKFSMDPTHFPKGNGELAKMSKKAYVPSDAIKDYTDNFTAAGLENLDYDEIQPDEDWVSDLVKGSSRTGNNPKWANAVETGVNDKRDKIRKENLLGKLKKKAYNKAPQKFVIDKTGEDEGDKILTKLESISEKSKYQINEEFDRMKELLNYNRKTQ